MAPTSTRSPTRARSWYHQGLRSRSFRLTGGLAVAALSLGVAACGDDDVDDVDPGATTTVSGSPDPVDPDAPLPDPTAPSEQPAGPQLPAPQPTLPDSQEPGDTPIGPDPSGERDDD